MCFYLHKDHSEAKVADKDITCYKVLLNLPGNATSIMREISTPFLSPHKHEPYELNQLKEAKIGDVKESIYRFKKKIDEGLHSHSVGLKGWNAVARPLGGNDLGLFKATIPKGATYYYNPDREEYVSNQLIVQKELNTYEEIIENCPLPV